MTETQDRTAAEVIGEVVETTMRQTNAAINGQGLSHEQILALPYHEGMGRMFLTTLADAGYLVIERQRLERLWHAAEEMEQRIAERGWGEQYTQPGDLDPLPTREGGE